jgi:hypothetical protein
MILFFHLSLLNYLSNVSDGGSGTLRRLCLNSGVCDSREKKSIMSSSLGDSLLKTQKTLSTLAHCVSELRTWTGDIQELDPKCSTSLRRLRHS